MSMTPEEIWWDTFHFLMDHYEEDPERLMRHIENKPLPKGYVLMPIEPTPKMLGVAYGETSALYQIYTRMVKVAQEELEG